MRGHRSAAASLGVLLAAGVWLLATVGPALAQDTPPPDAPPPGPSFPGANEIAQAIFDRAGAWLTGWIEHSIPALAARGFLAVFGFVASLCWDLVAGLLSGVNILTQL